MIDLYYWPTPNGHKITMFLGEAGLDHRIHPVDIGAGAVTEEGKQLLFGQTAASIRRDM